MSKEIAVVRPYYATEDAYDLGYEAFDAASDGLPEEDFDFGPYASTAEWANTMLPKLRAMAGFADGGHGTYTRHRQVAAIKPGCEEDRPAEAELVDAQRVLDVLVDAFRDGARDGATGNERDPGEYW